MGSSVAEAFLIYVVLLVVVVLSWGFSVAGALIIDVIFLVVDAAIALLIIFFGSILAADHSLVV